MKIGINTLRLHFNYGGILQAYALQVFLKRLGHEVWLINNSVYKLDQNSVYEVILHLLKLSMGRKFSALSDEFYSTIICKHTTEFIKKYISPITPPIHNKKSLKCLELYKFDAIIVGSDQVWSKHFGGSNSFFLDFVSPEIKKIAYAASFGEDKWLFSKFKTGNIKKLAQKFDFISVREYSGIDLCREYLNVKATHVIDPTMLLTKEDYFHLCELENTPKTEGEMMFYILDENKFELGLKISNYFNLKTFSVRSKTENKSAPIEDRIFPPLTQWLRGFYDAQFIVTDSFHGCVFSIIFNKPFIVIEHEISGNARILSLLKIFGLENRLIYSESQLNENLLKEKIDFDSINKILENEKVKATNFLITALKIKK